MNGRRYRLCSPPSGTQPTSAATRASMLARKSSRLELRQGQPAGRPGEPLGVLVRPEQPDAAVGVPVGLQPLEDLLRVVQHRGGRVERERPVRHDRRVVPAVGRGPGGHRHVVGEVHAETGVVEDRLALRPWCAVRGGVGLSKSSARRVGVMMVTLTHLLTVRLDRRWAGPRLRCAGDRHTSQRTVLRPVQPFSLAVIGGDGIGPEVVAEGLKVLDAVVGRRRDRSPATTWARALAAHRRGAAGLDAGRAGRGRRDPARRRRRGARRHRRAQRAARAWPAAQAAVRLRPLRQPAAQPAVPRRPDAAGARGGRAAGRSTSSSSARAPRACTRATAASSATGTPAEIATEVSVNTAYGVERVVRDAFERATRRRNKLTLVHKHNVLVHAGGLWRRIFERVAAEYPAGHHRLPARRRGDDLPGHRPGPVRRDRHRQPVRRHPHRPGRGRDRRHRAGGQRQHQPGPAPSRRCSSRCTARRPTSPVRASPTRRRRSCRSPCCLIIWGSPRRPPGSRRRWWRTWPADARVGVGRRTEIGDAIAAAV